MLKSLKYSFVIAMALIVIGLIGCAGGERGKLDLVEKPTESELRRDWKEYDVYYRSNHALVFKVQDDRQIILGGPGII